MLFCKLVVIRFLNILKLVNLGQNYQLPCNVTDLGIAIDSQLRFTSNINVMISKAHAQGLIHRRFISRDRPTLIKALITYVRSLVEYVSCTWSPTSICMIKKTELVQKRFTKRLTALTEYSLPEIGFLSLVLKASN